MSVRKILTIPHPLLRQEAREAEGPPSGWKTIIEDLWDTLNAHTGVGIAATQIGKSIRIIAVDASRAKRPVPNHGPLTLVNPRILERDGHISFREGCLSGPDYVAHIERAATVVVSALNQDGHPVIIEAHGFEAVIIQHEIDHLDGILFIDRVKRARDLKPRPSV
ncbi:MAG: peptide deformylase [Candidatus Sumerlaeaceae bacterium]|nr:peptide deformylase [Candidatus Sumerlaeaceae bacterium]